MVTADTTRLPQVFSNLLTHAVKFTPRGGLEPFRQADARFDRATAGWASASPSLGNWWTCTAAPSTRPATAPARVPADASPPSLGGVEILLVDDEPDTLTMFRDALESAGARGRAVGNAAEALRATETWRPDLLVTDLRLPGMDGYDLLQAMRLRGVHPAFPAVAVSAVCEHRRPDPGARGGVQGSPCQADRPRRARPSPRRPLTTAYRLPPTA